MVCNVGRMIPAMAMITSSVEAHRRGAFLSANSSVQHVASGLGAYIGGLIVTQSKSGLLENFGTVGWIAAAATILSLWLAGRIEVATSLPTACDSDSSTANTTQLDVAKPVLSCADVVWMHERYVVLCAQPMPPPHLHTSVYTWPCVCGAMLLI